MVRATVLARDENRTRSEKSRVAKWVDVTDAISSGECSGVINACNSGVTGGSSLEPLGQYKDRAACNYQISTSPSTGAMACRIASLISPCCTKFCHQCQSCQLCGIRQRICTWNTLRAALRSSIPSRERFPLLSPLYSPWIVSSTNASSAEADSRRSHSSPFVSGTGI